MNKAANGTADVVKLCQDLIRIDTSNYGREDGPGERAAAEYVAAFLSDQGLTPVLRESAPRRTSLTALWPGVDRSRPPLVVHGHLDVVPAVAEDWSVDPFAAEIKDDMIWGRGAVDMKNMNAMILATVAQMCAAEKQPSRDIVLAFFADEEHGGRFGAKWMVENHPEDFRGADAAISEVGGFSCYINGKRIYLIQTAEKGMQWLQLIAHGQAGHGSLVHSDNAVGHLAGALERIAKYEWPISLSPNTETLLREVARLAGIEYAPERERIAEIIATMGAVGPMITASVRNTANPTVMQAGYKTNVIPDTATGFVDARFVYGDEVTLQHTIAELAGPHIKIEPYLYEPALEQNFSDPLVQKMVRAIQAVDPGAPVLPYTLMGGTDNKHLARLGIAGYGFAPLLLPPELEFPALFHGVDERVPIASLHFGVTALAEFFADC